jgi:regulator of sirC expression with transglutaminase-like and TPR domain
MPLSLALPTPLEYFASLVQSDAQFPLLETAASLAMDEYPALDIQALLEDVDQLGARLARTVARGDPALERLRALNQFFFVDLGFAGNVNDYYDAENSYLNSVLRTRRGIPISLAVLWLELAQGLGLQARGVAFPGHFMVKALLPRGQVLIDPFTGESLSREELLERLAPFQPGGAEGAEPPLGLYLQAAQPREIIARMLRNLKEVHRANSDWQRLLAVQERLVLLLPAAWDELRDRGLAHAECGHAALAISDLETYLAHVRGDDNTELLAERLQTLRRAMP